MDVIFGKYKVGSILNVMNDRALDREQTAAFISKIQESSMKHIGIPCIYGLDMIHGASYLVDGSFYPQEINLGATFNREYAAMMGKAMAYETRAAQCPWVFSPVMDLGRDPRWPRQWESWGEDPYLQAEMARTETVAIQGEDPNHIDSSISWGMACRTPARTALRPTLRKMTCGRSSSVLSRSASRPAPSPRW